MTPDNDIRKEAIRLIDRYFYGTTTLDEEQRLRTLLADPTLQGDEIDSARAVVAYSLFDRAKTASPSAKDSKKRPSRHRLIISAAAAVAFAIIIPAITAIIHRTDASDSQSGICVAYVDGHTVTDTEKVMAIIDDNLSEFSEALSVTENQINSDLSAFGSIQFPDDIN